MNDPRDLPIGSLDQCQICASKKIKRVLDLGHTPPCDSLLTFEELNKPETHYPLRLFICEECSLLQIDHVVSPEVLFHKEYPYLSGITETLANNLKAGARKFVSELNIPKNGFAIDIGSNDGTFLKGFQECGLKVLGVEPTNVAKIAIQAGVPTKQTFFSENTAKEIKKEFGPANIITAANMFAHIPNLGSLIRGAEHLLDDEGIFVTESHYALDIVETLQFDSIYHEHLKYYTIQNLIQLFEYYNFKLIDAERISNYGGSIRAYAQKGKKGRQSERLKELVELEKTKKLSSLETWRDFEAKVSQVRRDCRELIGKIIKDNKSICAIGCPGRSSTLLNYFGITPQEIPYIAEQSNCLKLGMYCAGVHIPVVDESKMFEDQPDYALMLSWHYSEPIIKKLRDKGLKSKIIIPLPEVQIIS